MEYPPIGGRRGVAEKHFCESKNLWRQGGATRKLSSTIMYGNSAPLLMIGK
jgi:hypothetical protein